MSHREEFPDYEDNAVYARTTHAIENFDEHFKDLMNDVRNGDTLAIDLVNDCLLLMNRNQLALHIID